MTTVLSLFRGLIFALSLVAAGAASATTDFSQLRGTFLDAEKALKKGDTQRLASLRRQLHDYPLLPYLDYQAITKKLSVAKSSQVQSFLNQHQGTPLADVLRRKWLNHLAKNKRWKEYLRFYTPQNSISRQCYRLQAKIHTGAAGTAWPEVNKIWLHGKSRPAACDPVFKAWKAAGKLTDELTWQRIELAFKAGQWRLARYLGKSLNNRDSVWLQRWIRIHRDPKKILRHQDFSSKHPYREKMLAQTIRRMASLNGIAAMELWQQIEDLYPFDAKTRYQTSRRIALALERRPEPEAYDFVLATQPNKTDKRLHAAHLHAALLRTDWPQVLKGLKHWALEDQRSERWRYWQARALEATGQQAEAQKSYRKLAKQRSYYGFLAADKVGLPYHLAHQDTPVDKALRDSTGKLAGVQRALELHALKRNIQARREWHYATKNLNKKQLKAAAVIAESSDWHDQAIFTLAKTGYWDDLELRFPLQHRKLVSKQAKTHQLDDSWIFAVIRQESAFMRDAQSHVGAMGLMQLMPATARSVAKGYLKQRKAPRRSSLLKPAVNIELGSAYLRQLLNRLEDNPVLATAAYNAGPHRVDRWRTDMELDADIWVDLIPFKETRRYLRRVMAYSVIYDKRRGKSPKRLKDRMNKVAATPQKIAGA